MKLYRAALPALGLALTASLAPTVNASAQQAEACAPIFKEAKQVKKLSPLALSRVEDKLENRIEGASAQTVKQDSTLWVDVCGAPYFVEPVASVAAAVQEPQGALYPDSQTFQLNSRPGAARTIYLDFLGGTVSNTYWNNVPKYGTGPTISYPAYSTDTSSAFSSQELANIQQIWSYVSEDFAPFNVNVTTVAPAAGVLTKDFSDDPVYGIRAAITQGTPIGNSCGCGGVAYVGITQVADPDGFARRNPAWVFADKLYSARNVAEAASHELGHNLGLNHDGTSTVEYHSGSDPWAPIMGVGYSQPLTQWSKGEYSNANNQQDDVSIIAESFPYLPDDHVNGVLQTGQKVLANNSTVYGMVDKASDTDVFKISGADYTTVTVKPTSIRPNVDLNVAIVDNEGTPWESVNVPTTKLSADQALGLDTKVTLQLPSTPATYHVAVSGAGQGNPATTGYSNYGSLGGYSISLVTNSSQPPDPDPEPPTPPNPPQPPTDNEPQTPPVSFPTYSWSNLSVGRPFETTKLKVYGGDERSYWWSSADLPQGLMLDSDGTLYGTPAQAGSFSATVRVASGLNPLKQASTTRVFTFDILPRLVLDGSASGTSVKGKRFRANLTATGGLAPYIWTVNGKLPKGVRVVKNGPGLVLKGKLKKPGTYRFKVTVFDTSAWQVTKAYKIRVKPKR